LKILKGLRKEMEFNKISLNDTINQIARANIKTEQEETCAP